MSPRWARKHKFSPKKRTSSRDANKNLVGNLKHPEHARQAQISNSSAQGRSLFPVAEEVPPWPPPVCVPFDMQSSGSKEEVQVSSFSFC